MLRKMLNITPPMPEADWLRAHQEDWQQLSVAQLQDKYHKTQGQVEYYLKVLKILKQNET